MNAVGSPDSSSPPASGPCDGARILVVDDEAILRELLLLNLRSAGFAADAARTGAEGLAAARAQKPAVIVLDWMLPDMLGTAVCAAIRHDPAMAGVGILMLTARGGDEDRIAGLEAGADDYVVKPFNLKELVLRVRGLARRSSESRVVREVEPDPVPTYRWQGLELEIDKHRVLLDGAPIAIRPLEFKLLKTVMGAPGRIFSRGELMRLVWGVDQQTDSRTVDTHVRRLRDRLGPYGEALETVHRFGYRWREEGFEAAMTGRPSTRRQRVVEG